MAALNNAGVFAQDVALSGNDQALRVDPKADRACLTSTPLEQFRVIA